MVKSGQHILPIKKWTITQTIIIFLVLLLVGQAYSFISPTRMSLRGRVRVDPNTKSHEIPMTNKRRMLPTDHNSFLIAVEVFNGSDIVDTAVVSNIFWTSLQTKLISFIIGQFLAAAAFSILLSLAAFQFSKVTNVMSEKLFSSTAEPQPPNRLKIPKNLQYDDKRRVIQPDFAKLLVCLAVDVIGTSSELFPFVGEISDIVWAPIAGLILRSLYGSNILFVLELSEEILPFTDILPLCTLCWVIETFFGDTNIAKLLQLGQHGSSTVKISDRSLKIDNISENMSRSTQKFVEDSKGDRK